MGIATVLLVLYVTLALGTSFLCSVLEAALLSSREMDLSRRAEEGDRAAKRLLVMKRERVDDAVSAILTLNTIAHTVGATMAGAQAAIVFGDAWVGVFSGVLTFLVLVVTEIIPKTLGTVYASRLAGFVGLTIALLMKALAPVLFFTRLLTRLLTRKGGHELRISRRELAALVSVAARQGHLTEDLSHALSNLLRLDEIRVCDVMTPRTVTWMMPVTATIDDLLRDESCRTFSRCPLYRGARDLVEGYILVRDVLAEAARTGNRTELLTEHLRPIKVVSEHTSVAKLLESLLESREQLAIVVDEFGGMEGLVTMEDGLETLLGREILDELDTVADLRKLAMELRDQRIERREARTAARTTP